jgi:inosine-uridine nucleoside N-ribohydrolase
MKTAIKKILKRIFIFIAIAFVIYLVVSNISFFRELTRRDKLSLIIDSDAARGQDDLMAIARIFLEDEVDVVACLSAQWRLADLDNDSTVELNQAVHQVILKHFNRTNIPNLAGAELPVQSSKDHIIASNNASSFIIKRASQVPAGEKMILVCLGPVTNLATAILSTPEITQQIICYIMGPYYEPSRRVWNKNEWNTRNDLDAMDIVLNAKDLELHIMPATIAQDLVLDRSQSIGMLPLKDSLFEFMADRWKSMDLKNDSIPMGSLALIEAILHPEMSSQKQVITPPENLQRKVHVYTQIDAERMKKDLRKAIEKYGK